MKPADRAGTPRQTLEEHIRQTAAAWPDLTADQISRLSGIFTTSEEK